MTRAFSAESSRSANPSVGGVPESGQVGILDVGNPAQLRQLDYFGGPSGVLGIEVRDDVAYAAAGPPAASHPENGFLQVVEVSNLEAPSIAASDEPGTAVQDVVLIGKLACLAVGGGGIEVLSLEDPTQPKRLGGNSAFDARRLNVAGGLPYVAGGTDGLNILETILEVRLGPVAFEAPGVLRFQVSGPPGLEARLQRSTDLRLWDDWNVVSLSDAPVVLEDSDAGSRPRRVYRAVGR